MRLTSREFDILVTLHSHKMQIFLTINTNNIWSLKVNSRNSGVNTNDNFM